MNSSRMELRRPSRRSCVMTRSGILVMVALLLVAACAQPQPSATSSDATHTPTATPSAGSPLPALGSPSDVPATSNRAEPWWAVGGVTTCGSPALYRIGDGQPVRLGDCAGLLLTPPAEVRVSVGAEIDLHITTEPAQPTYPLSTSPDHSVLRLVAFDDNGATGRYLAVADGELVLGTSGPCLDTASGEQRTGACPVLKIVVGP